MDPKKLNLTPAAMTALLSGDVENFLVAATPGGIEAQEAQGQKTLCASSNFPKECHRPTFEKMGLVFGDPVDDIFVSVTFPDGWRIQACEHYMHSQLVDSQGRSRAHIFYKAAFYDRSANAYALPRYRIEATNDEEIWPPYAVMDYGTNPPTELLRVTPDPSGENAREEHIKGRKILNEFLLEFYSDEKMPSDEKALLHWENH